MTPNDMAERADQDLRGVDWSLRELSGERFTRCRFDDADLSLSDLTGTVLARCDLSYARLTGAVLTGADLRGADLTAVDLRELDLTGVRIDLVQAVALATAFGAVVSWEDGQP